MTNYTNKFIQFLNNYNTIAVKNGNDLKSLNAMVKKVGLELPWSNYFELYSLADNGNFLLGGQTILIEYNANKGFSIGWKSIADSKSWFDMLPFGIKEVKKSIEPPKEQIYITCYGTRKLYTSREKAIKEFQCGFNCSEGCERERYATILNKLLMGETEISDEY